MLVICPAAYSSPDGPVRGSGGEHRGADPLRSPNAGRALDSRPQSATAPARKVRAHPQSRAQSAAVAAGSLFALASKSGS
jgi:hypothetical protein